MPKEKINDISMYYEIHGSGEPIVFIAGFSVDHNAWLSIVDLFRDKYQLILLDNRGAGQTDVPSGPYGIEQMAEDVVALCKHLGIRKAHFVGSSMGGYILQFLCYQYASLVKSATICNSTFKTDTCFHFYAEAQLELLKAQAPLRSIIKASISWVFSFQYLSQEDMIESLIQLTLGNPYPFTIPGHEAQYAALMAFNSGAWLGKIRVPTLVLAGDQDLIFSETSIKALAEMIPNAQYFCFKDCGHVPFIEYPQAFAARVQQFIAENT